jgi:hypothetical protein
MSEIDVYHGSPHRFEEFDASKIGTGEGAQAYGHGVYLAESPRVAQEYARSNQGRGAAAEGLIDALPKHMQMEVYKVMQRQDGPIKDAMIKDVLSKYPESASVINAKSGNLYTADLPDEMVDRMLDYDLPINQQSPAVKAALERAGINSESTMLAGPMAQGQEGHLAKFGIPGIKYMDEGSRGYVVDLFYKGKPYSEHQGIKYPTLQSAQERIAEAQAEGFEPKLGTRGTRNFVVFPGEEKKVKILKRE